MSKKRVNGEGSIAKLAEDRFMGKIMIGRKNDGTPNRVSVYGKSEKEVSKKLRELASQADKGTYILPVKLTLGEWLLRWLPEYKVNRIKPRTYDTYESQITTHILPEIGNIELKDLKTYHLQRFINLKYDSGDGLSPATLRKIHNILNAGLQKAVNSELITKNPCEEVELPALEQKPIKVFSLEERKRFFEEAKSSYHYNAFLLCYDTGIRMSECLALTWQDIDLTNRQINVNKTLSLVKNRKGASEKKYTLVVQKPKTKASIRKVPLTLRAFIILSELKLKNGLKSELVFPSQNGTFINPRNFERTFQLVVEKAGAYFGRIRTLIPATSGQHNGTSGHLVELIKQLVLFNQND